MKRRALLATCLIALVVGGCAVSPRLPPERRISVAEVIDRVQCELHEMVQDYTVLHPNKDRFNWLLGWAAAYELTLQVDTGGNVKASTDLVDLLSRGIFTLSLGAGATEAKERIATIKFSLNMIDLKNYQCVETDRSLRYFAHDTGVRDWFDRVVKSFDESDRLVGHLPSTFSQSLEFKLKLEGNGSGLWTFVHANTQVGLSGSLEDSHKLSVAFAPIEGGAPSRQARQVAGRRFAPVDRETKDTLDRELLNLQLRSLRFR